MLLLQAGDVEEELTTWLHVSAEDSRGNEHNIGASAAGRPYAYQRWWADWGPGS